MNICYWGNGIVEGGRHARKEAVEMVKGIVERQKQHRISRICCGGWKLYSTNTQCLVRWCGRGPLPPSLHLYSAFLCDACQSLYESHAIHTKK